MKNNYTFPAIFETEADGISIFFPDLPGCLPCADNMEEAFKNAREALQLHLFGMEEDGEKIPEPSNPDQIKLAPHQVLTMIDAWMPPFREKMLNKAMNKTVTIPRWLNTLAEKENVNYSHVLQEALKNYLGVNESADWHFTSDGYHTVKEAQALYEVKTKNVPAGKKK
jgi:predicted RNase H-like HicB family nuclease